MKLESLKSSKFEPLPSTALLNVRGGETKTGSGSEFDHVEWDYSHPYTQNGTVVYPYRSVYKTWGSDAVDGRDTCFYEPGWWTSEWSH